MKLNRLFAAIDAHTCRVAWYEHPYPPDPSYTRLAAFTKIFGTRHVYSTIVDELNPKGRETKKRFKKDARWAFYRARVRLLNGESAT